jgi:hypothetical protein
MTDASAKPIRYFALSEDDDADDDSGQQGRSGGAGRMYFVEIRCYPKPGRRRWPARPARWVLKRTVVPVPSSSDASRVLGDAVDNYVATKISDRAFAFSDTWWIVSDPGRFGVGAAAVQRAQQGLHQLLLGDPAQAVCQALGGPVPGMVGGIAGQLPLPVDRPLEFIQQLVEVGGMAFGVFAGIPVLTTACCKAFLHDQLTRTVARGTRAVMRDLLTPAPEPPDVARLPSVGGLGGRDRQKTRAARTTPWDDVPGRWAGGRSPGQRTRAARTTPLDNVTRRAAERNPTARGRSTRTNRGGFTTSR